MMIFQPSEFEEVCESITLTSLTQKSFAYALKMLDSESSVWLYFPWLQIHSLFPHPLSFLFLPHSQGETQCFITPHSLSDRACQNSEQTVQVWNYTVD